MENKIADYIIEKTNNYQPEIAIITGSGLGEIAEIIEEKFVINYSEIETMPKSYVAGHKGRFIIGELNGKKVICLQGRIHLYEGFSMQDIYKIIEALSFIGVKQMIVTNAAGSLDKKMPPSSIMIITNHINFSGQNPLVGIRNSFIPGDEMYDSKMIKKFKEIAKENKIKLYDGIYLMTLGPNFETTAEIAFFRMTGARAVGMSTVPEVLSSGVFNIKVAALSLITNFGTGLSKEEISHELTLKNAEGATKKIALLIKKYIENL